jgi:hypothetical protein
MLFYGRWFFLSLFSVCNYDAAYPGCNEVFILFFLKSVCRTVTLLKVTDQQIILPETKFRFC